MTAACARTRSAGCRPAPLASATPIPQPFPAPPAAALFPPPLAALLQRWRSSCCAGWRGSADRRRWTQFLLGSSVLNLQMRRAGEIPSSRGYQRRSGARRRRLRSWAAAGCSCLRSCLAAVARLSALHDARHQIRSPSRSLSPGLSPARHPCMRRARPQTRRLPRSGPGWLRGGQRGCRLRSALGNSAGRGVWMPGHMRSVPAVAV